MPQDTLVKKTAYAAIGVPVQVASQVRERIGEVRRAIDDMRERVSDEAQSALDEWIAEGERIISSLTERVQGRREEVERTVRESASTARDTARGVAATLTQPIAKIDAIDGIGPSYAEKLAKAGIISTRALVERCTSSEAVARLAEQTGISEALISKWASAADLTRVTGIGDEFMSLLNRAGVATVEGLANATPKDLQERAAQLNDELGLVDAMPSTATISGWIQKAKSLV